MASFEQLKLKNQLCFPLYAASREIIKRYRPFLDALGLTYTQYITMMVLWEKRKLHAKELGERLYLDSGTLTPVLKSLEEKGYLCRYRSLSDERMLTVELTKKGESLKQQAADIPERIAGCVKLEPQEAEALYGLLYKLLESDER